MQGETTSNSAKTEIVPQTQAHPHHHTSALFDHEHHPYQPRNVNLLHKAEQKAGGINTRIAVALTKSVGTMWTAYTFMRLAIIGLAAILGLLTPIVALLVVWISQTFLQLFYYQLSWWDRMFSEEKRNFRPMSSLTRR